MNRFEHINKIYAIEDYTKKNNNPFGGMSSKNWKELLTLFDLLYKKSNGWPTDTAKPAVVSLDEIVSVYNRVHMTNFTADEVNKLRILK